MTCSGLDPESVDYNYEQEHEETQIDSDLPQDGYIGFEPFNFSHPTPILLFNGDVVPRNGVNPFDPNTRDWFFTNPIGNFGFAHPNPLYSQISYRILFDSENEGFLLWSSALEDDPNANEFVPIADVNINFNQPIAEGLWVIDARTNLAYTHVGFHSLLVFINIQRTRSFVDIDGQRNSPISLTAGSEAIENHTLLEPIVNPSTIAVGRVDEYSHWGEVDENRSDWFVVNLDTGDEFRPGDEISPGVYFDPTNPNALGIGRFQVVNIIYESPPSRDLYQPLYLGMYFPDGNVRHESTGYFVNTVGFEFEKHNNDGQPLPGAEFTLERVTSVINAPIGTDSRQSATSAAGSGLVNFTGLLPGGEYRLTEIQAPEGFATPPGYWLVNVEHDGTITITTHGGNPAFGGAPGSFTVGNAPATLDLTVNKAWVSDANHTAFRPLSIQVQLLANNAAVPAANGGVATLNEGNNWQHTFNDLPRYDAQNNPIAYDVQEVNVPTGYADTYVVTTGTDGNITIAITNTFTMPTINIPVTKVWNDNNNAAGFRPSDITVQLRVGSTVVDTATLNNGNSWQHTFANLPHYSAPGVTINYEIYEPNVPTGYASVVTPNANGSVTITNTLTLPTRNIPVTKVWNDNDNAANLRPTSITVELRVGDAVVDSIVLNQGNSWTHTFTNLPRYSAPGVEIVYTVYEPGVPTGYSSTVAGNETIGFTVTNTFDGIPNPVLELTKLVNGVDVHDVTQTNLGNAIIYTITVENTSIYDAPAGFRVVDDMSHIIGTYL